MDNYGVMHSRKRNKSGKKENTAPRNAPAAKKAKTKQICIILYLYIQNITNHQIQYRPLTSPIFRAFFERSNNYFF
jgi:hypothetical protein